MSEHPSRFNKIKWEGLYVALSRVKFKEDVRLLLRNGDRSTIAYIQDLEKNTLVKSFFKGYVPETSENGENTKGLMKWNSEKASKAAGFFC